jgi:hypothetical protein
MDALTRAVLTLLRAITRLLGGGAPADGAAERARAERDQEEADYQAAVRRDQVLRRDRSEDGPGRLESRALAPQPAPARDLLRR